MIHRLLIFLTRDQAGFFYREGMITGYNSPFPSSKNPHFKTEAESRVKQATNSCRTSPKVMLRVLLPTNQTCIVANKIQCCKLREYWLLIGWNYAEVTPYTGVTSLASKQVCLGPVIKPRNIDRFWCKNWNFSLVFATNFRNLYKPDLLQGRLHSWVVKCATSLFN